MNAPRATGVALLTAPGRGAIATLRVRGPAAIAAADRYFTPAVGDNLQLAVARNEFDRPRFGRWHGPTGEELIVCVLDAETIEIHCHGGIAAAQAIVTSLVAAGCEQRAWQTGELLGESDPLRRAALVALSQATTQRTAAILLEQYAGALPRQIQQALKALEGNDHASAQAILDELLAHAHYGLHLTQPFRVVLAGAPNVGKSSLINALMGYERSIVHERPGTTRDAVTANTAIDGWPVLLTDTAGIRAATDPLERAGITLALAQAAEADLVLFVIDRTAAAMPAEPIDLAPGVARLMVQSKCDLPLADSASLPVPDCLTSAVTGEGIGGLVARISASLAPHPPAAGAAVPFTTHQVQTLRQAREQFDRGEVISAIASLQSLLTDHARA